ncbi:hypothetical protein [Actinosynnema mirum]|uniref:hypothetical protein n=1 Tax=Actinosynnema mirum TaxID=40567 RepID=UPI001180C6FE|nr:hypothetical protein [Actinosynnema mirum]
MTGTSCGPSPSPRTQAVAGVAARTSAMESGWTGDSGSNQAVFGAGGWVVGCAAKAAVGAGAAGPAEKWPEELSPEEAGAEGVSAEGLSAEGVSPEGVGAAGARPAEGVVVAPVVT